MVIFSPKKMKRNCPTKKFYERKETQTSPVGDFAIEIVVLLLMATGTVFVYSAGASVGYSLERSRFYETPMFKQVVFFPLAVGVLLLMRRVDYHWFHLKRPWWKSTSFYLVIVSLLLLVAVLIFGQERNQSKRWLDLLPGPAYLSFQPSELAKWVMIIFTAAYLDKFGSQIQDFKRRFLPICLLIGLTIVLIIIEDFGTAAFIALITFLLLWIGGAVWWHMLSPLVIAIPGFLTAVLLSPTRINRIKGFFSYLFDEQGLPYQAQQSLKAISAGGLWGAGLGRGVFKYGHLPEDTTDFIFAVIAEEMGFIGAMWILVLFALFLLFGIRIILRCPDRFGKLLSAGIVFSISIQAAINIGVVTVVLPTKGIPLPFVSAGGTSLLLTAAATGILLNIARQSSESEELLNP